MSTGISGSKTVLMTSTTLGWSSAVTAASAGPICGTSPVVGAGSVSAPTSSPQASGGVNGEAGAGAGGGSAGGVTAADGAGVASSTTSSSSSFFPARNE